MRNNAIYEDEEDFDKNSIRHCSFKNKHGEECNRVVTGFRSFCTDHVTLRCWCGGQATHVCIESLGCEQLLCNERYCVSTHNERVHLPKWVFHWG